MLDEVWGRDYRETGTVSTYNGDVIQDDEEVMGSLHQLVTHQITHLEKKRNCKTAFRGICTSASDLCPLSDELRSVELCNDSLQHLCKENRQCDCESTSDNILHRRGKRP